MKRGVRINLGDLVNSHRNRDSGQLEMFESAMFAIAMPTEHPFEDGVIYKDMHKHCGFDIVEVKPDIRSKILKDKDGDYYVDAIDSDGDDYKDYHIFEKVTTINIESIIELAREHTDKTFAELIELKYLHGMMQIHT